MSAPLSLTVRSGRDRTAGTRRCGCGGLKELPLDDDFERRGHVARDYGSMASRRVRPSTLCRRSVVNDGRWLFPHAMPEWAAILSGSRDNLDKNASHLDCRAATDRVIAEVLFGAKHSPEHVCKTSNPCNRTVRLVQSGFALMRGR